MFVESGAIAYARQMRIILSLLLVFAVSCLSAETVYKSVDEEGNIIFTDKPSENAEVIILQELQTIKNPNPGKFKPVPRQSKEVPLYNTLIITSPADGSGIRNNAGNVSISVSLEPTLRSRHQIIIALDGKEISKGSAQTAAIQNVERGSHTITASVVDANDKSLKTTSSSFSLLRASQ